MTEENKAFFVWRHWKEKKARTKEGNTQAFSLKRRVLPPQCTTRIFLRHCHYFSSLLVACGRNDVLGGHGKTRKKSMPLFIVPCAWHPTVDVRNLNNSDSTRTYCNSWERMKTLCSAEQKSMHAPIQIRETHKVVKVVSLIRMWSITTVGAHAILIALQFWSECLHSHFRVRKNRSSLSPFSQETTRSNFRSHNTSIGWLRCTCDCYFFAELYQSIDIGA